MSVPNDGDNLDDLSKFIVSANAGDFIFREQDPGADMYIIRTGQVELLKQYAGQERQIAILEPGDFFGEMSLLEQQPREISARAIGAVDLLRIDATTFDRIVQEAPEIPVRMLRKLCRRLREYQEHEVRAAAIAMGALGAGRPQGVGVGVAVRPPLDNIVDRMDAPGASPAASPSPDAAPRAAFLVDAASKTEFELSGRVESTIGRIDRSTGFTPDVDLTALDSQRTLSRRHAKIIARDGEYFVREEIGTRNGTFVNGTRVQTGVDVKLEHGNRLRFGLIETVFELR